MKFSWKNFPEMLLTHDPKSEILKKAWKNFPRNPLSDHPVLGNIFQDLSILVKWFDLNNEYILDVTSILVMVVGDNFEMLVTVLAVFCHQYPLSFNNRIGHQHSKDVTCHQHPCSQTTKLPKNFIVDNSHPYIIIIFY